jgi:hypothetical protein
MSNNEKHTPTPWRYEEAYEESLPNYRYEILTDEEDPWQIASIAGGTDANELPDGEEERANAEHIVLCVNTHDTLVAQRDALLEACRLLLSNVIARHKLDKNWGQCGNATGKFDCQLCKVIASAEAAIAKVEEQP